MSKKAFDQIMEGLNEALAFTRGELDVENLCTAKKAKLNPQEGIVTMLTSTFKSAVELGLDPLIYDGLKEVLRKLESGELVHCITHYLGLYPSNGFNMADVLRQDDDCGTVACIAGWLWLELKDTGLERREITNNSELTELFYPNLSFKRFRNSIDLNKITVGEAASTLRQYLTTGIIDWKLAVH